MLECNMVFILFVDYITQKILSLLFPHFHSKSFFWSNVDQTEEMTGGEISQKVSAVIFNCGCFFYSFFQNCDLFSCRYVEQHTWKYFLAQYCQERRIILQNHKKTVLQKCFCHSVLFEYGSVLSSVQSRFLTVSNILGKLPDIPGSWDGK